jgi:hypothetical protein
MNHPCIKCCLIIVCIAASSILAGQPTVIKGKILDSASGNPIEYAYILNYSLKLENYSNSKGEFRMNVQTGDTMVIFAIGYFYQKVIVAENMFQENSCIFLLSVQPADLGEATIPVIGTYDDFKNAIVNLDRPLTPFDKLNNNLLSATRSAAKQGYQEFQNKLHAQGVSLYSTPILTPEEKERIKLAAILKKDLIHEKIYIKFNPALVKQVTGLTEDDEIIRFMLFCHFPEEYLLEVNEYDLAARIASKYEMFKKMKEDENRMKEPVNRIDFTFDRLLLS